MERLSGGERRRLELVALIARGGNLLVLDEPTNHLDVESREALEAALEAYDGTVLMVSHDRALIDAIATHTLAIEDGARRAARRRLHRPAAARARGRRRAAAPARAGPARRAGRGARRRAERRRVAKPASARCAGWRGEITARRDQHRRRRGGSRRSGDPGRPRAPSPRAARSTAPSRRSSSWLMREWEQAAEAAAG